MMKNSEQQLHFENTAAIETELATVKSQLASLRSLATLSAKPGILDPEKGDPRVIEGFLEAIGGTLEAYALMLITILKMAEETAPSPDLGEMN